MHAHLAAVVGAAMLHLGAGQAPDRLISAEVAAAEAERLLEDGNALEAETFLRGALRECQGDAACEARVRASIGDVRMERPGGRAIAEAEYREALKLQAGIKQDAQRALGAGDAKEALRLYQAAVRIEQVTGGRTESQQRAALAQSLTELGRAHQEAGEVAHSVDKFQKVLSLHQKDGNLRGQAEAWELLGLAWAEHGDPGKAYAAAREAIRLAQELQDAEGTAHATASLGAVSLWLGSHYDAAQSYEVAVVQIRSSGKTSHLAESLEGYGLALAKLQRHEEAIDAFEESANLFRQRRKVDAEARVLTFAGKAWGEKGNEKAARDRLADAVAAQRLAGSTAGEAATYAWLASVVQKPGQASGENRGVSARASTWLLKRALSLYDEGDPRLVERQAAFYGVDHLGLYRAAAQGLVEQNRIPEAVEVLSSLKEQESQLLRRSPVVTSEVPPIPLTESEQAADRAWEAALDSVVRAREEVARLDQKRFQTELEKRDLNRAQARLNEATTSFRSFLERLALEYFSVPEAQFAVDKAKNFTSVRNSLRVVGDAAAVYTVSFDRQLFLLLVTPDRHLGKVVPIPEKTLSQRVQEFRAAVQSPNVDPKSAGNALFELLVAPLEPELAAAGVSTIVWQLDGVLRYVPLPALWDGERWLVERYRTVVISQESHRVLERPRVKDWTITALGASVPRPPLRALPGVRSELNGIVRDEAYGFGLLSGKKILDDAFSRSALEAELRVRRPVVHLATHYVFGGAPEKPSFLLLGDGTRLSLDDFDSLESLNLDDVDLLVLSACETALNRPATSRSELAGAEVDGIAEVAHRKGAASVLATLWRIWDASAPSVLTEFYRRHQRAGATKAQALQEAQLALLRGNITRTTPFGAEREVCGNHCDAGWRGSGVDEEFRPNGDWSHPAHWAPFILLGNWR